MRFSNYIVTVTSLIGGGIPIYYRHLVLSFILIWAFIVSCHTKLYSSKTSEYHWTEIILDHNQEWPLWEIAASDSAVAILGDSVLFRSSDGLSWRLDTRIDRAQKLVWNGFSFYTFSPYVDRVSSNLYSWDTIATTNHPGFLFAEWFDTMFIASDDGMEIQTCLYSKDGIDWDGKYATVGHPFLGIAKRDSIYVAVGGRIMVSYDAMWWTEIKTPVEFYRLRGIAHNPYLYVAVGSYGTIMTSADAATWQKAESPTHKDLEAVAWNGEIFVAVGGDARGAVIVNSRDGKTWSKVFEHRGGMLHDVAWYKDHFIAVGNNGLIIVSYQQNN
ncbi:MAG: hypothetical protein JSV52_13145 [Candidatus Zixiibacteriota bacterium]|nr:MAG: hypothetical protein JSV52_13145 [candidate division Zixibacteria bacterium]